jgi:hypothetical protein
MRKQKGVLEDQVPEYGLEALVSIIDDNKALIAAQGGRRALFYIQAAIRRV